MPASDFVAHSPRVAELAGVLDQELASIRPAAGQVRLFSTVAGRWMDGPELDAGYWYANVRQTVRFAEAVRSLVSAGHRAFIEVSAHPVLTAAVTETAQDAGAAVVVSGTLDREDAGAGRLLSSLARMHTAGITVDWAAMLGGGRQVDLPTYAFQRQWYWPESAMPVGVPVAGGDGAQSTAEARFWAAVEGGDAHVLSALAVPDQQRLGEVLPALAAWRRRERDRSVTEGWRYRIAWVPVTEPDTAMLSGTWLVVVPAGQAGELAQWCEQALTARGARVAVVEAGPDELVARIGEALADGASGVSGLVSLLALDETPLPGYPVVSAGLSGTLALVQALAAGKGVPLWALTRGAVAVDSGEALASPVQAMTWGLGRVAALEHPLEWGGLIDVPAVLDERAGTRLCGVLAGCGEDQVAIRSAGILGRRLVRAPLPRQGERWVPGGTVLVTGGTGAIGGHVARYLAGRGASRIVLASRSGPAAPAVAELAAGLAATGTEAMVIACDMAKRAHVAGLLTRITGGGARLAAVMHTAGIGQATTVANTTVAELATVAGAKVAGAVHLDELTRGLDLERFVLFSSAAATWGSGGEPGYAAANEFLNGLAQARLGQGRPATSVGWGPWSGGGLIRGDMELQLKRRGLPLLTPSLAVQALGELLDNSETLVTVANVDWPRFARPFTLVRPSPLIESLPEVRQALAEAAADDGPAPDSGTALGQQLAGLPPAEQDRVLVGLVRAEAAVVLGHSSPEAVEAWPGVQRHGVRFADRGRAAEPAERRDRAAAARHAAVRLPQPDGGGGIPAAAAGGRAGRADGGPAGGSHSGDGRRAGGDRGDGLPVPGRDPQPAGPVGAGRLRDRRDHRFPGGPRLGPGRSL